MHFILFADDTNLFYSNKNYASLISTLNAELHKLSKWFCVNKLSLNVKKTNYLIFGYKHLPHDIEHFELYLDGNKLEKVKHTKYLGVYIENILILTPAY